MEELTTTPESSLISTVATRPPTFPFVGPTSSSRVESSSAAPCNCRAHSKCHNTSPILGRSTPYSAKHFSAASTNLLKDSPQIVPAITGSTIFPISPLAFFLRAHSAKFTCSLGRPGSSAGLAHSTSNNTTPNEYTSDFSVSCCRLKYSGSRYPKLPFTAVLTCVWSSDPGPALESPKSETLATKFSSRRIFVVFTSRWIILPCAEPVWR
ncbi:MORN (Membrane Occupation and Recognition Nexus)repeat-containing protein [Striga asiatica]|uniref:MORN (Membrane Occupation and Recognition Nexus)repeat-containing protein n=1 Tax=Striga asiatica TaxID=4170 RepID=A0A5A7R957_STRAF|nr:MORN (Membrane Occupation and Recognition Nexus)repeat-containing protein [Striga asiatica]